MSKQIWLLDLPEACKSGGLDVSTFDGWETRSRSSGGYDDLLGIGYHHDASPTTVNDANVDRYGWVNADAKPIGAMRLHRDGTLVVGAAGATNTMGRGGPLTVSRGTIPKDRGNQTMIAIEAGNSGIGEPWSKTMVDAYVALVGALCKWYGLDPARDIFGHYDYCLPPPTTGRKIDPAGPTPSRPALGGLVGAKTWSLSGFRTAVKAWNPTPAPTPEPTPPPGPMPATPKTGAARDMYLIMKYGGTPDSGWSGYYSDGNKRYGINSTSGGMDHVARLVRAGAKDAKTNAVVTSTSWAGVSHTTSSTELTKYLGPA